MNLILVHDSRPVRNGGSLLRFALTTEPLRSIVLGALSEGPNWSQKHDGNRRSRSARDRSETIYAVPRSWEIGSWPSLGRKKRSDPNAKSQVICYDSEIPLGSEFTWQSGAGPSADSWLRVSNGQFVTRIDNGLLEGILGGAESDLVAVNAEPGLSGAQERIRLTTEGNVAGFRRVYSDSAELAFVPADWPHHLFIRANRRGWNCGRSMWAAPCSTWRRKRGCWIYVA
ncbi:MAG: hypothetical protein ACYSWQ_24605 [Planctomycetota bacterium]